MILQSRLLKETLSHFYFIMKGVQLNLKIFKIDEDSTATRKVTVQSINQWGRNFYNREKNM